LAAAIAGMRLRQDELVLMDTHAGVEHFGRALARGFDSAIVVVEPTFNASQVGLETARLARELGIGDVHLVINRARGPADRDRVLTHIDGLGGSAFDTIHLLPFDQRVLDTEPSVDGLLADSDIAHAVSHLAQDLLSGHRAGELAVTR